MDRFKEPDEERPIAIDWNGDDIFDGDEVYVVDGEYLLKSNLKEYIQFNLGPSFELYKEDFING